MLFPVGGDRFGVFQFTGVSIIILKNHLGMRVGDPALIAKFLGHVKDIVDLDYRIVRIESFHPGEVG
jgi:hypothetical protein